MYVNEELAIEALIGAHTAYSYKAGQGHIAVYCCDDCGQYHFTSKGPMNDQLYRQLSDGRISKEKEANHWISRFKKR